MTTKFKKSLIPIFTVTLFLAGVVGATLLTPKIVDTWDSLWDNLFVSSSDSKQEYQLDAPSQVLPLALLKPEARKTQLETIAKGKEKSLDRARARYLLASDLIKEYKGGEALNYLKKLEKEYTILAPYILLRRGRAYELTNEKTLAQETWQEILTKYPESLVCAEALYKLGKYDAQFWQQAINSFPQHPRTHEIAYELLKQNPNQLNLLLLLSKYDNSHRKQEIDNRLVKEYATQLKPEDWQSIADGYWNEGIYNKAVDAYKKVPVNAENLYRLARSYQLSDNKKSAKISYQELVKQFPDAPETGIALRRIAALSQGEEALSYLNLAINKFPEEAPSALTQKASILTALGKYPEALQTRQTLINNYPKSDEAANYRWQVAKSFASAKDLVSAWQWAQQIIVDNPDSDVTPKAGFWIGKWAKQLGQEKQASDAFQYVLNTYPQSYYAWRSAVQLGKKVGDFQTLRPMSPNIVKPQTRSLMPAGSVMFKELFLLGEDEDAIDLFTAEIANQKELSVAEEFTKGVLLQIQGNNLESINLIWSLKQKDDPQALTEWQILRKSPEYWYALFPFPFEDFILEWSKQRQLNPLLVTALIRQESRFEPEIKSPVGATGLMQVMPDTAKFIAPQIKLKTYSLTNPNDNINLGTWYLDHTHQTYKNNSMLAVASYNAGPGKVAEWTQKYDMEDLDVFVENIPYRETKGYIETVFGNYWNYLRIYDPNFKT